MFALSFVEGYCVKSDAVVIIGDTGAQGAYLLRMALATPVTVAFGRFAGGREFALPAGDYLYIGSAMGKRGASTLAARLLRHATRSGDQPPHPIRNELFATFTHTGFHAALPKQKHCHWHVDFLLDQPTVTLRQVYVLRTATAIEQPLASWLAAEAVTTIVVPGLGASDHQGATHLLHLVGTTTSLAEWWQQLPAPLTKLVIQYKDS